MRDRCDLATHRECSCIASGVQCRTQPGAKEIIRDADNDMVRHDPWLLVLLAAIVWAITFYAATKFGTTEI